MEGLSLEEAQVLASLRNIFSPWPAVNFVAGFASKSPTREIYDQLTACDFESAQACVDAAKAAFVEYSASRCGTLYWRTPPEFGIENHKWAFYMRLLISDKPVRTDG